MFVTIITANHKLGVRRAFREAAGKEVKTLIGQSAEVSPDTIRLLYVEGEAGEDGMATVNILIQASELVAGKVQRDQDCLVEAINESIQRNLHDDTQTHPYQLGLSVLPGAFAGS